MSSTGVGALPSDTLGGIAVRTARRLVDRPIVRFACVGSISTGVHLCLFAVLHQLVHVQLANLAALVMATAVNTALNRRWTFGVTGRDRAATHHALGLALFLATWAASSGALRLLAETWPDAPPPVAVSTVLVSMVVVTLVRFTVMARWMRR